MNKQGQYVMTNSGGGAVTPGAAADEVRVDCCLMTGDGRNVVTGSSLGPPQVWDMQVGIFIIHDSRQINPFNLSFYNCVHITLCVHELLLIC